MYDRPQDTSYVHRPVTHVVRETTPTRVRLHDPQSVPITYTEHNEQHNHVIREAIDPIHDKTEITPGKRIIERVVEKETLIWNEKVEFVDTIVDVPYDVYEIEYYSDEDGDIIENVPHIT